MDKPATLIVVSGPDKGREEILESGKEVVIGRAPGTSFRLSDGSASKRHCKLKHLGSFIQVEDLGSANGTRINGTKITATMTLNQGAWIEVGQTKLEMIFKTRATPIAPPKQIKPPKDENETQIIIPGPDEDDED